MLHDLRLTALCLTLALTIALALGACTGGNGQYRTIRLKSGDAAAVISTPAPVGNSVRVAVASVISPKGTVESYSGLLSYLSQRLDRPVELVQRQTYAETNDLIKRGAVELAFVCSGAYVQGQQEAAMELLAVPQVSGETVYYSNIIVPYDNPAQSFAQLRGKVFAFTDPLSNSGYLATAYLLETMGSHPGAFFRRTIYTYSHDNSIKAVAEGLVDGASVDSLVYDYALARDATLAKRVRVIARSAPYGMPPVVVPRGLDPELKARLRQVLMGMHEEEQGAIVLEDLMIDRFVPPDDTAYDSIRAMLASVAK